MASLKDLRNRIASVKATQKITKAMQMVAAAKLRRAQEAAEAARPYAERMDRVLANLAASIDPSPDSPPLLAGTGKDDVHLLVVCTAERGLCGGFNSSIARLAREHAQRSGGAGQDGQDSSASAARASISLRRQFATQIIERVDLRAVQAARLRQRRRDRARGSSRCSRRASSTSPRCSSRDFKSVITQIPTAQQLIPARVPPRRRRKRAARSTNTSPTRTRSSPSSCRATSRRRSSARSWRTRPPSRARA